MLIALAVVLGLILYAGGLLFIWSLCRAAARELPTE